jgi:NNP family nitrate/nitrite transporter-like MFS transporter
MRYEIARTEPGMPPADQRKQADRESAAIIGFISAIAAYGAFYIPKAYGTSIQMTGTPNVALWSFLAFYVTCAALTWFVYSGSRGILYESERRKPSQRPLPA